MEAQNEYLKLNMEMISQEKSSSSQGEARIIYFDSRESGKKFLLPAIARLDDFKRGLIAVKIKYSKFRAKPY